MGICTNQSQIVRSFLELWLLIDGLGNKSRETPWHIAGASGDPRGVIMAFWSHRQHHQSCPKLTRVIRPFHMLVLAAVAARMVPAQMGLRRYLEISHLRLDALPVPGGAWGSLSLELKKAIWINRKAVAFNLLVSRFHSQIGLLCVINVYPFHRNWWNLKDFPEVTLVKIYCALIKYI